MRFKAQDIIGVNPIVAMPFTQDGEIDPRSFKRVVEFLESQDIQGMTLFGVASEFPKLTDREKSELVEIYLDKPHKEIYKAISITDHSTEVAIKKAQEYQAKGADALMLLPPFFLSPSQEEVERHIEKVLKAVDIPVMVQYAPNETGFEILPGKMAELKKKYDNAVFKIECNPPVEYTKEFLALVPDAVVLNGYAGLYMLEMFKIGGKGVMPGCSFTDIYTDIYRLWQAGDFEAATKLHASLFEYIKEWMTHCEYIIQVEKTILYKRGIIESDYCRHPNYQITEEDKKRIESFIIEFRLNN